MPAGKLHLLRHRLALGVSDWPVLSSVHRIIWDPPADLRFWFWSNCPTLGRKSLRNISLVHELRFNFHGGCVPHVGKYVGVDLKCGHGAHARWMTMLANRDSCQKHGEAPDKHRRRIGEARVEPFGHIDNTKSEMGD
jgi:hypothetical protein